MITLIQHITQLVQVRPDAPPYVTGEEMNRLPVIENAYVLIRDGLISEAGPMENLPAVRPDRTIDASGRLVWPAWTDSHTHAVFAEPRYGEFIDKIRGLSYEEIAARGGGIGQSAARLRSMSEEQLYHQGRLYVERMMQYGTGAVEIKSGYGLSVEGELKMLRVIRRLGRDLPIPVKATFLGAHAVPAGMDKNDYVRLLIDELLPEIGRERLADYVDVFCERGYFDPDDTARLLDAARRYGLKPKVHVNQFSSTGCLQAALAAGALSVDHLEVMTSRDLDDLARAHGTMATVLPGCSFFLGIPYAPAKKIIARNIPLVIATDFNPGSSPSWNMNMMVALACIKQKLTPEQAINAATLNAATALELSGEMGSITPGKKARLNLSIPLRHYGEIPYYFGTNPVAELILE